MILAIDIGNTNIVLGCMEGTRILVEARMATDLLKTSDQYCVELKNLLNLYEVELPAIEGVIISSVVPPVLNSCKTAVRKLTGKTPLVVGPGKSGADRQRPDRRRRRGTQPLHAAPHHCRHGDGNHHDRDRQDRHLRRRLHQPRSEALGGVAQHAHRAAARHQSGGAEACHR